MNSLRMIKSFLFNGFQIISIKQQQLKILLIHDLNCTQVSQKWPFYLQNNKINKTDMGNTPDIACLYIKTGETHNHSWYSIPGLFADEANSFLSIVELNVTVDRELSMTRFFSDVIILVFVLCDWWVKPVNDRSRYNKQQMRQIMFKEWSITNLFFVAYIQCMQAKKVFIFLSLVTLDVYQ